MWLAWSDLDLQSIWSEKADFALDFQASSERIGFVQKTLRGVTSTALSFALQQQWLVKLLPYNFPISERFKYDAGLAARILPIITITFGR